MSIELSILPHQNDFLKAIQKAFEGVRILDAKEVYQNPIIDLEDDQIKENINELWKGYEDLQAIPKLWQTSDDDSYLGLDIRMETGERVIIVMGALNVILSRVSRTLTKYYSYIA